MQMLSEQKTVCHPIEQEYRLAQQEHRQPNCVYCGKPLTIIMTQYRELDWQWDGSSGGYVMSYRPQRTGIPQCANCGQRDENFADQNLVYF
jgi:ribosomal protein L34E